MIRSVAIAVLAGALLLVLGVPWWAVVIAALVGVIVGLLVVLGDAFSW